MKAIMLTGVAALLAAAPAPGFQAQALVAQYDLDEMMGSVARDTSTNTQDGSFTPEVQLGLPGARATTGRSAGFDPGQETRAWVDVPVGLQYLRSNLSVSAWVYPEADNGVMRIFANSDSGWSVARSDTGLWFSVRFIQDYVIDCEVPLNTWTHVAFVYDGLFDVNFYVNGVNVGTKFGIFPAYDPSSEWSVGSMDGQTQFWDGRLDDIQVYQGDLTAAEVAWLYANPGEVLDPTVGTSFCFGDGQWALCPCANYGANDAGCKNSTDLGGRLFSGGSPNASVDDLTFVADQLPANKPVLLFVGNNATNNGDGVPFGDGLRCVGGGVWRLGVRITGSSGSASWGPGLQEQGGWEAGDMRRFQAWYRDPVGSPCGSSYNLTQGVQIGFVQ